MSSYPIQLTGLKGRRVLIAGGGPIAARKVAELRGTGAQIHLISLELSPEMEALLNELTRFDRRAVSPDDVEGAALVIAATGDRKVDRALAEAARARGIWVNAVDDPEACTFFAPAVVRRGAVTISIGTEGQSPLLSAQLRRWLEALIPDPLGDLSQLFVDARRRGWRGLARRASLLKALLDPKLHRLIDRGEREAAAERLDALASRREEEFPPGTVAIAGAGPGSRELLTLRALDRIQRADLIIHDALVEPEVLAEALPGTRLIDGGRRVGRGGADQALTEALMIKEARAGLRVLRLHAGDPMVFGRGGEELRALRRAGVPVQIIPGVSAAFAAPAVAGIPLTERGVARAITIRTGHSKDGALHDLARVRPEDETLVILMGLGNAVELLASLIAEGRAASTPAAAISCATREQQQVVVGTLADLAERVRVAGLESPTTLVVGEVARSASAVEQLTVEVAA